MRQIFTVPVVALALGCSGTSASNPSVGGTSSSIGGAPAGGSVETGGATVALGGGGTGGVFTTNSSIGSGGTLATGGSTTGSGGSPSTGGIASALGGSGTGGNSTGGAAPTGGSKSQGGVTSTGGKSTGGAALTGGSTSQGGAMSTGGTSTTIGGASSCAAVTPTACASGPTVRITEVDISATGAKVVVNEDDAALKLLSISAVPSGGSRVAWMGSDSKVHVTTLDCNDNVVSTFGLAAMDYGDIYADDKGGVLLVARDAQGGGTLNCGAPTNLCGTPPSPAIPCYDEYMVRFDGSTETWATKLTTSSSTLPPYSTGPTGPEVYFIWWYSHHGRLAFDGTNWAGYYGSAISVSEACTTGGNTAINIHQGDEMRVVSPTGALLTGHNSFDWGCSHSTGFPKIVWDPTAARFVMVCRSDAYPNPGLNVNASKLVASIDASNSAVSNLVLAATASSYWVLVSNVGALHLYRFTSSGGTAADVNLGTGYKPHLVSYGNRLFAAWSSTTTGNMVGQAIDASTGATIGSSVTIAAPSNQYQDFRTYPDGSVAYVAPGSTTSKLKIVRAMPCQ